MLPIKRGGVPPPPPEVYFAYPIMKTEYQIQIVHATAESPCPHCGKPDWCYLYGDLSVCNRDAAPADGWYKTSKTDKDGHYYYAPDRPKTFAKRQTRKWDYTKTDGTPIAQVVRIDKADGSKPVRFQNHWTGKSWAKGLKNIERSDIAIYKYIEIQKAIADKRPIFIVEGEKCADRMWEIGLAATTNIGGSGKWTESDTSCLAGATEIIICPDRDKAGIKHGYQLAEQFPKALWCYTPPSQFFWLSDNIPESQGLDVADYIDDGADEKAIKAQITALNPGKFSNSLPLFEKPDPTELVEKTRNVVIEAQEIFTQKAVDCLYSDSSYISIHDKLYRYNGTHYELCSTPRERRRILEWCRNTPQEHNGRWKYSLAKPETVNKIWIWVLTSFAVDSEEVNPPGLNCLNGILQISWQGRKVSYELVPHDPEFYFTHVANFEYDPDADDRDCNRLLAALDTAQQTIFLRTIAASLDLPSVRKYQGRAVKALLCQGTGSNGKDTLREAVRCILGAGMTSASVTDFQQYDQGRKFPLTKIEHSQINWSSENSQFARLDSLQGLKAAITGETIDIEPKNSMEYPITPRGVFLFNVNESPLLEGGMEAIASRWAVLSFNKTFKKNANVLAGELEADSRFRYDPEFLERAVCPALLNKILEQLQSVVLEGIDYSVIEDALTKIQEQSNHLWQFINEVGIERSPGSRLYISDLWEHLLKWYERTGTLEYRRVGDRLDKIWHDQPRASDKNITARNQMGRRFKQLYPDLEIKRHRERDDSDRRGQTYLCGLILTGSPLDRHETQSQSAGAHGSSKLVTLARLISELDTINESERLTAITLMENYLKKQSDIEEHGDPCAPADSVRDTSRSNADPLLEGDKNQRSLDVKLEDSLNTKSGNNSSPNVVPITASVIQTISVPITNTNSSTQYSHPPIDWIKDKAGVIWQVDKQEDDHLEVHRSGLRGSTDVRYEDVEEFHYVKQPQEAET